MFCGTICDVVNEPASINPRIIEGLYCEALVLADEVRSAFVQPDRIGGGSADEDFLRVALSCEALRTTTRMMNAIAWLLNYRAFFMGELTEFQLRRHCRLLPESPISEACERDVLSSDIRELVLATERFHARLSRIDDGWRRSYSNETSAVSQLRQRLETRVLQ